MHPPLKIVLFILGQKGYAVLTALHQQFSTSIFDLVVFAKDSHIKDDYSDNIRDFCKKNKIACVERHSEFHISKESYQFAIGWRWIIENEKNLIVLHDSLLPKYRGFAPLVNALINGEDFIGVTALLAKEEYDKGPILFQKSLKIDYPIKIQTAIDKISVLYSECIIEVIHLILNDALQLAPQNEMEASYSPWRSETDYFIDWHQSSEKVNRFINAVGTPYAGAKTTINGSIVTVLDSKICSDVHIEDRKAHIGKVIFCQENCPVIICGLGLLKITSLHDSEGNSLLPLSSFRTKFS